MSSLMSSSVKYTPAPKKKSRPVVMRVWFSGSTPGRLTTSSAPTVISR